MKNLLKMYYAQVIQDLEQFCFWHFNIKLLLIAKTQVHYRYTSSSENVHLTYPCPLTYLFKTDFAYKQCVDCAYFSSILKSILRRVELHVSQKHSKCFVVEKHLDGLVY